jgi:hypothetical protein
MKLRIHLGQTHKKEVSWWDRLDLFPSLLKYQGKNYEWFCYDTDPSGQVDSILNFSELPSYDPNYSVNCVLWTDMFKESELDCQCGSIHTSFPQIHMFFCPKWTKF